MGPMLASTNCNFKKPLFYPGTVILKSRVGFIKNTSFSIQHLILNNQNEVVAEAEDIVVFYDFNKNEKARIPGFLKDTIKLIEQRDF